MRNYRILFLVFLIVCFLCACESALDVEHSASSVVSEYDKGKSDSANDNDIKENNVAHQRTESTKSDTDTENAQNNDKTENSSSKVETSQNEELKIDKEFESDSGWSSGWK